MSSIHVCSYRLVEETALELGASHLLTLLAPATPPPKLPARSTVGTHMELYFHDIPEPRDNHVHPSQEHIEGILDFARSWDRRAPMLIHCWAGISRSTAAAFVSACFLQPEADEAQLAVRLRAASPTATPNPLIVEIADAKLERGGRMVRAIEAIGRGATASEGIPFGLPIGLDPGERKTTIR